MRRTALLFVVVIAGLMLLVDRGSSTRDGSNREAPAQIEASN
jgi:hypothetical protein